jgi:hypothetical protein
MTVWDASWALFSGKATPIEAAQMIEKAMAFHDE